MKINAVKNYLIYGSGQLINLVAPLLVAPKVISVCGFEKWGKIGVAISIFTLLGLFIDFSSNILGVKEISTNKNDFDKIRNYLNVTFLFKFIILITLFIIFSACIIVLDLKESKLYFLGLVMFSAQFFNITWIYQGQERFLTVNKIIFLSKFLYVILIFILIKRAEDYIYVLFLLGVSNTFVYFFFFLKTFQFYKLTIFKINFNLFKEYVKNEYSILISNISISIYTQCPILIVGYLLGDYSAGIYKVGDMILSIFRSYLSVFFNVSFPNFCSLYSKSKSDGILFLKKVNSINVLLLSIVVLCCIVFGYIALDVLQVNIKTRELVFFYGWFLAVPIIVALNVPFYQFLIFNNEQKTLSIILSFGSLLMLLVCFFLTKEFQLNGSLLAVFLIEAVISFLIILYCCTKYKVNLKKQIFNIK